MPVVLPFDRILVTGANGFVGRHLLPALRAALRPGARIILATRRPDGEDSVALDLSDAPGVDRAVRAVRPDLVVHLAAQASVGQSLGAAAGTWRINLCGSLALADAVAAHAPDATLFFVSSVEGYGLSFNDGVVTEATPLQPQGPYARSKAAAEAMLADVLPPTARLIVVRPSNHSGPGQDERFVIPAFAAQIARAEAGGSPVLEVGNLEAERDFLDVRDVVAGYLALLCRAESLPARTVLNIASGRPIRIADILARLQGLGTIETRSVADPARMRPSEVPRTAIDAGAFRAATGWVPQYTIEQTLAAILADQRDRASRGA